MCIRIDIDIDIDIDTYAEDERSGQSGDSQNQGGGKSWPPGSGPR